MHLRPHSHPHLRLWTVWLALLVAVLVAAAPTVSHALAFAKGGVAGGIEICTTAGPRTVLVPSGALADTAPQPDGLRTLEHCALCLQATDHAAPPPHSHTPVLQTAGRAFVGIGWKDVAHSNSAYTRATPRGPPALSQA